VNLFGLVIRRKSREDAETGSLVKKTLDVIRPWGSGWPVIGDWFPGAWQRNNECKTEDALAFATVWRCVQLISSDISKLGLNLIRNTGDEIWEPTTNTAHSPVLRDPNHFQSRIQFYETWVLSKLLHGNTYVLKQRDARGLVVRLFILDATRVYVLVGDDGSVFYQLATDNLAGLKTDSTVIVPASEMIHDRMTPAYHPLVGISPIRACALSAMQGLKIQNMAANFFENEATPSGVLTAVSGTLSDEVAKKIQERWSQGFGGANRGKVAVLGADLKYQQLTIPARDAQLVEQLKMTGELVCTCFGVPPYKVVAGATPPPYASVEALQVQYYTDCLQVLIENIELLLDRGLELPTDLGVEFDLDSLLRMDTATLVKAAQSSIGSGGMSPNEARKRFFGLGPVTGGDTPYLQQQNFSLSALAKRDAREDPFAKAGAQPTTQPATPPPAESAAPDAETAATRTALAILRRSVREGLFDAG
jgi:HK97 family phage portal protein